MARSTYSPFSGFAALLALLLFTMSASAAGTVSYCSNQNTGSTDAFFWTWQSNGKCTDHCNALGTYAFAVIQYKDCWCSNYIPSSQVDTQRCMVDCPGFPSEKCGDIDNGLYIYLKLDGSPSGTQGASRPTSTTVSTPKPLPSSTEESSYTQESSSTEAITTKPTSTIEKNPPETEQPEQPQTSLSVITESGAVITRTIVISPTSAPSRTGGNGGGSNTGAIVGGVIGGLAVLLAIVGAIVFFLWRKRKQRQEDQAEVGGSSGITRNTSTMSKAGLLGHSAEKGVQYPRPIATSFGSRSSRHDGESISPITASDRRLSQPLMIDSRLDPRAVLTFHGSNVSRDSLASIDDSRDYGRQLNVRNPDPETRSNY